MEAAVKSAKHILLTADDVELALLSARNTAPAGHAFSPAQRLFGRQLRTNLPQPASKLVPSTPPPDIVIKNHTRRKMQQKRAYDKHAGQALPDLLPQTNVYAKLPPTLQAKEWIPGKVVGRAGPRSYIIKTAVWHIRRNRTQIQESSPFNTHASPPSLQPMLPDVMVPNDLTAQTPTPYTPCPTQNLPETGTSTNAEPSVVPSSSLSSEPQSPPEDQPSGSSALPARQTVTRSGRVVRCPARYSD